MKTTFLILASLMIISCSEQKDKRTLPEPTISTPDSTSTSYVDKIKELESESSLINYDSLGKLISTIRFDVKTDNLIDYEKGIIPNIRIDSPQIDLKNLIGKDKIVIPEPKLTIIIDYPLTVPYKFELTSKNGFTRTHLINEISKHYYQLYEEEEKTATIKTIPIENRKIFNRNQTNGRYGIWGHDIGDLVLDEIHLYKKATGELFIVLQLES